MSKNIFASDQEVRWCPGCGDYAVLATIQRTFAKLGIAKENTVFVSGIGCASRLPYYMNTYGFHTIHGRATAVATGLKYARPDLNVWVVVGDGDGLSIGLGHLLHLMRRNVQVKILLLNNQIYGLTKGQFSPTSQIGQISNTSPYGSTDMPFNPIALALTAKCGFVARAIDIDAKNLGEIITAANEHQGTAFVEIYQNCNVYNNGVFASFADKSVRKQKCIYLRENEPLVFGENNEHGLQFCQHGVEVVNQGATPAIHTAKGNYMHQALKLAEMDPSQFPVALGIFKQQAKQESKQLKEKIKNDIGQFDLEQVFHAGQTWAV